MNWFKRSGKIKDIAKGLGMGIGIGAIPFALMNSNNYSNQQNVQSVPNNNAIVQKEDPIITQAPNTQKPQRSSISANKPQIDINKIIEIESGGNSSAQSEVGATGVMQVMPKTWSEIVRKMGKNYTQNDMMDPIKNREVGTYYMNIEIPKLLQHFHLPDTLETRLAAYNWGVGAVSKAYNKYGSSWLDYAPQETQNYIQRYLNQ